MTLGEEGMDRWDVERWTGKLGEGKVEKVEMVVMMMIVVDVKGEG